MKQANPKKRKRRNGNGPRGTAQTSPLAPRPYPSVPHSGEGGAEEQIARIDNVIRLSSLEQLEAACTRSLTVVIRIYDQDVAVPMRLLLDREREVVERILLEVVPPVKKPEVAAVPAGKEPAPALLTPQYEMTDPAYQEKLRLHRRMARAVTLYLCVPMFAQKFPGLESRDEILKAVSSCQLTEMVLEHLFSVAMSDTQKLDETVNFT
jgi:hypothetical protein